MTFNPGNNPPTTTIPAFTSSGLNNRCFLGPDLNHLFVLDNKSFGPKLGCSKLIRSYYKVYSNHD